MGKTKKLIIQVQLFKGTCHFDYTSCKVFCTSHFTAAGGDAIFS
jgi:hypothetical protein